MDSVTREEIARQSAQLDRTNSHYSRASQVSHRRSTSDTIGQALWRMLSHESTWSQRAEREMYDTEAQEDQEPFAQNAEQWALAEQFKLAHGQENDKEEADRALGVTWQHLTVRGLGMDAAVHENALSQFNIPQKIRDSRAPQSLRTILDDSHGCVKPGEMLLVLGRPGAGCTTLLKMLANKRGGYREVKGNVRFGSMTPAEAAKYRAQIVINTEEEIFFPSLTVSQTMDFATRMKVSANRPDKLRSPEAYQQYFKDFLLASMGIEHTNDTKVGNEYIRGVSGGERKRISIIECLASRASVFCWDNSTRGLDASTALEWTKAVRAMTDILKLTTIATLYQAGNGIYNLFDKVLVLDEGKQIYYGPTKEARPFMEKLGFICDNGANVADFLTGVTVPTERAVREECRMTFPKDATSLRDIYLQSEINRQMSLEYDFPDTETTQVATTKFKESVTNEKAKEQPKSSPFTVPFKIQTRNAIIRQYQIIWGDKATFAVKNMTILILGLVTGSLFYDAPDTSAGLFSKGGALFISILAFGLMAMSEVTDSFSGRAVLAKHKDFAFYHPAAFCIAQISADIPVILCQITVWSLIIYFMVGLQMSAGSFFTFWIVLFAVSMCMTAMFRLVGASFSNFDDASKVSGFLVGALIMYSGYMIPKGGMYDWFVWIYWIDPLAYAFSALMGNEFKGRVIACVRNNLIPSGPGYTNSAFAACAGIGGASVGATSVTGEQYLRSLSYSSSNVWRNFGILWAWWALFAGLTIFFTTRWHNTAMGGGVLLIPRERLQQKRILSPQDEESQSREKSSNVDSSASEVDKNNGGLDLVRNTSIFTWKNLSYTVKTPSGDRLLLDGVQGWVKPGMLGALMGSSGAGKTTLMDVLAQRKTDGTIRGSILVDGRPLPISFQRSAGYCEQLDVHEPYATVREALEFSALLRQSRDTPEVEKLKYVDTVIDLLELHDLENSLIGRPGAGLSVEQRKRVTIGVELVAKPSTLIFLDEPTSGLDGQAAFNTLRFLKKLAAAGQAVLCTIHQPSAQLFAQFDTLLLLAKGGKTVYFGDIGENGKTIRDYFGRNGAPCPPDANPAEHMIDVVSGHLSRGHDWNEVWLASPECQAVTRELDAMIEDAASKPPATVVDDSEFATTLWTQTKLVTHRMNLALFRNLEYVNNKIALHVGSALFNGFSFWMIGNSVNDLQLALFSNFNFIFVAPGVIAQLQPLFISRRDIYDAREKKSKMYSWIAFVTGLIVSEIPYLIICAVFYFVCFYYTVGFPSDADKAGAVFFVMLVYEFIYTGMGQFVAAYAPNAVAASLINPFLISMLTSFCGVLMPYNQIQTFWRYWMYYLNPFTFLMGSLLTFTIFDKPVHCSEREFAVFDTPNANQTCADYLADYRLGMGSRMNLTNPEATSGCRVCQYTRGSDYLDTLNIKNYYYGWQDAGICVIYAFSSYILVYVCMKLRTKTSKKAE
ncbi:uncharacterized protein PV06_11504 [Exophiala oligosperma]|uniref:ABC transporter domain-containing protein n=1 Tax=Exophiala oligosperma TaxID=215243 RepID=A0A0D2BFC0_9EURO|nr:uncharacterized protein PV06_11504 [Exophiala oligosperma]KIW36207.1 hypothetical protein PV06_11504 [Exophiala oligosperma]